MAGTLQVGLPIRWDRSRTETNRRTIVGIDTPLDCDRIPGYPSQAMTDRFATYCYDVAKPSSVGKGDWAKTRTGPVDRMPHIRPLNRN